jgi:hypothetical protein
MRWLKRKYTKLRLVSLSELLAKPVSPSRFVIEREDGMLWAGPYRFQGASFTNVPQYIYYIQVTISSTCQNLCPPRPLPQPPPAPPGAREMKVAAAVSEASIATSAPRP